MKMAKDLGMIYNHLVHSAKCKVHSWVRWRRLPRQFANWLAMTMGNGFLAEINVGLPPASIYWIRFAMLEMTTENFQFSIFNSKFSIAATRRLPIDKVGK